MTDRFLRTLSRIDGANAADPRRTPQGKPFEIDHADRLTAWMERLIPSPSENLRLAARGQHIERWTRPREAAPPDRAGYLKWRESLKEFHAQRVAGIMREEGYLEDDVRRVEALITKRAWRAEDPEGRALEDGLCLVFLETQLEELRAKTPDGKMRSILGKTCRKMSEAGRAEALRLPLAPWVRELLQHTPDPTAPQAH